MKTLFKTILPISILLLGGIAYAPAAAAQAASPDTSKLTFQRVCGTCHAPNVVTAQTHTSAQWQDIVNQMMSRGLSASDSDIQAVLDYLVRNYGPAESEAGAPNTRAGAAAAMAPASTQEKPPYFVDKALEAQGKELWAANCINCHGTQARGSDRGANLIRSQVGNYDRSASVAGSVLGPFLQKGHPTESGKPSASFTGTEVMALANFLRARINDTMRGAPTYASLPQNLLAGDAQAGESDFAEFGCARCHNENERNLKGIASRAKSPQVLQAKVLYPRAQLGYSPPTSGSRANPTAPKPPDPLAKKVTITPTSGAAISGTLLSEDAFFVTYSDATGIPHTIRKTPNVKIEITNPMQWHLDFANRISDTQLHDLTVFLWSLK